MRRVCPPPPRRISLTCHADSCSILPLHAGSLDASRKVRSRVRHFAGVCTFCSTWARIFFACGALWLFFSGGRRTSSWLRSSAARRKRAADELLSCRGVPPRTARGDYYNGDISRQRSTVTTATATAMASSAAMAAATWRRRQRRRHQRHQRFTASAAARRRERRRRRGERWQRGRRQRGWRGEAGPVHAVAGRGPRPGRGQSGAREGRWRAEAARGASARSVSCASASGRGVLQL